MTVYTGFYVTCRELEHQSNSMLVAATITVTCRAPVEEGGRDWQGLTLKLVKSISGYAEMVLCGLFFFHDLGSMSLTDPISVLFYLF